MIPMAPTGTGRHRAVTGPPGRSGRRQRKATCRGHRGSTAPDRSQPPDPAYMTTHNRPVLRMPASAADRVVVRCECVVEMRTAICVPGEAGDIGERHPWKLVLSAV